MINRTRPLNVAITAKVVQLLLDVSRWEPSHLIFLAGLNGVSIINEIAILKSQCLFNGGVHSKAADDAAYSLPSG